MSQLSATLFGTTLLPGLSIALALPAQAQTPDQPTVSATCQYDAQSGQRNPLATPGAPAGQREIIVRQIGANTEFTYREQPSIYREGDGDATSTIYSAVVRTLTFQNTPIDQARQLLSDEPADYAELLGLGSVEELGDRTYAAVDQSLTCQTATVSPGNPPDAPAEPPNASFADLPDGNYRLTSADLPFRVVTDTELLETGGTVFLFKKTGDRVVGDFFYPETDASICITGTLNGNIVNGPAILSGTEATVPESDALTVTNLVEEGRFENAVLNLSGFSRINAGTALPRENCEA